ncbi:MAG: hypothetical protein IT430_12840 [Phycisphaerales bacterium]|nr:hypothetical protein [Phycisphaerales bacterium]
MNSRAVIACAIAALLSGCASSQPQGLSRSAQRPASAAAPPEGAHRDPALAFATPEVRQMLAARWLAPGFTWDDWEYSRNDARLSVGAPPPRSAFGAFQITQYDRLYDFSGRPRSSTQTTVRSIQGGATR